jgi:hypothetical protein
MGFDFINDWRDNRSNVLNNSSHFHNAISVDNPFSVSSSVKSPFGHCPVDWFNIEKADGTEVEAQVVHQEIGTVEFQKSHVIATMQQLFGPNMRLRELRGILFAIQW